MAECIHVKETGRCELTMTCCNVPEDNPEICSCYKEKEEEECSSS